MYKRILSLSLFFISLPLIAKADIKVEETQNDETDDFFDGFLDKNINYNIQPKIYCAFYPKVGCNTFFESSDPNKNTDDHNGFSFWRSRNYGANFSVNMPIKATNFFYAVAFDFSYYNLIWENYRNLQSKSLFFGESENFKNVDRIFQKNFSENVKSSSLGFLSFNVLFQIGYKSDIFDHRHGFFTKLMLGTGFQFNGDVGYEKEQFLLETTARDYIPLRNIKFLYGAEIGYWRFGLSVIGDLNSLFTKEEKNSDKTLGVDRRIHPLYLSVFFDIL